MERECNFRYADLKQNEERNENWYNNGEEEQVDR